MRIAHTEYIGGEAPRGAVFRKACLAGRGGGAHHSTWYVSVSSQDMLETDG